MNVQEFLTYFRNDISNTNNIERSFDEYEKWHLLFFKRTADFHKKVKESYFEQTNKLIDENDFQKYNGIDNLSEFAYLGLFGKEDEVEFSNLIKKLTFEGKRLPLLLLYKYITKRKARIFNSYTNRCRTPKIT